MAPTKSLKFLALLAYLLLAVSLALAKNIKCVGNQYKDPGQLWLTFQGHPGPYDYRDSNGALIKRYPHLFQNTEGFIFTNCPGNGVLNEFPVTPKHLLYTGGRPGPDRLVYRTDLHGERTLCLPFVTHTNALNNSFNLCTQ
ncbi:hypothetical protein BC936DRAFT_142609 [Jimgerdemannia flammicorona]|uniref:Uncharacterized protein n=1 Tax=Jimgerdemannia flammicorona TaxID=994334 RepID=A0A433DEZ4_9FUNG|nr:hypothetical protein BC936DRAFT_142609 [Jimgerdemannia flammicorona]